MGEALVVVELEAAFAVFPDPAVKEEAVRVAMIEFLIHQIDAVLFKRFNSKSLVKNKGLKS